MPRTEFGIIPSSHPMHSREIERSGRSWILFAVALIALATVPRDFQGHTHWEKVGWLPFLSPPVKLRDIVVNTLLYVPLGVGMALNSRSPRAWTIAAAAGAVLSLSAEFAQLYSHVRFPSATDVVCNVVGAVVGTRGYRAWSLRSPAPVGRALRDPR